MPPRVIGGPPAPHLVAAHVVVQALLDKEDEAVVVERLHARHAQQPAAPNVALRPAREAGGGGRACAQVGQAAACGAGRGGARRGVCVPCRQVVGAWGADAAAAAALATSGAPHSRSLQPSSSIEAAAACAPGRRRRSSRCPTALGRQAPRESPCCRRAGRAGAGATAGATAAGSAAAPAARAPAEGWAAAAEGTAGWAAGAARAGSAAGSAGSAACGSRRARGCGV